MISPGSVLLSLVAALLLLAPEVAGAQGAETGGVIDQTITGMKNTLDRLGQSIGDQARNLLLALLVLDFVWRGGKWAINDDRLDSVMQGFLYQLGFVTMIWGVTLWAPDIIHWLAETALKLSQVAGGGSPTDHSAGAMVNDGMTRAFGYLNNVSITSPRTWLFLFVIPFSIILVAITVALLIVIYAELYLAGLAGIVALAFAGLSETKSMAMNYLRMILGKAMKLMALMVILAVVGQITSAMARSTGYGIESALGMILLQVVSAVLILTLPSTLEQLVSSARGGKAGDVIGAVAGGAAKFATKIAAVGGVAAAAGAVKGAVGGAKGASGTGGRIKAGLRGAAGSGATAGVDWGRTAAKGDVRGRITRGVGDLMGSKGESKDKGE